MFEILYVIKRAQFGGLFIRQDLLRNDPISVVTLIVKKLNTRRDLALRKQPSIQLRELYDIAFEPIVIVNTYWYIYKEMACVT